MKRYLFLVIILTGLSGLAHAQVSTTPPVTFNNPPGLAAPKGYTHLVEVDLGKSKMLVLSGQVAINDKGQLVGKDDVGRQTEQAFLNIKHLVEAGGGTMDDVIKLTFYLRDVTKIQAVRDLRDKYINKQRPPASTLVEVSKLFRDDILIEIEATAIVAKK